jgi:YesN/AraC family two-component response regulator
MDNIRVLLVDDEQELIDVLSARLGTRGFEVDTAMSGDEALSKLQGKDYDVVILDVFMPGKDGIQTLKEMKALKPLTEVVMLSGNATLESAIEGMQHGAFDFLVKPADMGDLVEKLNKGFARKAEHEERIRKAGFIKEQILEPAEGSVATPIAEALGLPQDLPPDAGRLLVIGRESDFSQELIQYALEISQRMSYAILAMNVAGFSNESFKLFPKARERVCQEFQEISEKNASLFKRAAHKEGIPFAHIVKLNEQDEAIDEVIHEVGHIDYVVSEADEGPNKGEIVAYCPM